MKILVIIALLAAPLTAAAQLNSNDYRSPLNGVPSAGGIPNSADYSASGTVVWYDCSLISSDGYGAAGIGNVEILGGKVTSAEDVEPERGGCTISPNPVTELSAVHFTLKTGANVQLMISDVTGATVYSATLADMPAGEHSYSLSEFSKLHTAGVFLLKIDAGTAADTQIIVCL